MRATLTAVIAAIEAGAVALAGLVVIGVPAVLMWIITFGLDATPAELVGGIASVWFLAHGVPLQVSVTAEAALGLGLPGEAFAFPISLAPLGLSLVTVLLAMRAGWRFASRGGTGAAGVLGGGIGYTAVGFACLPFVAPMLPEPEWRALLTLGLIYAVSMLIPFVVHAAVSQQDWFTRSVRGVQRLVTRASPLLASTLPLRTQEVLRLALGALAALAGIAAAGFTVSLIIGYVDITALSQNLQLDPLGASVLFIVQLAFLPIALIWSMSWFVGTGFAVGVGTSVSPFDALVGPIPALPLMGAIPPSWGGFAPVAPAIIVIAGLVIGVAAARRSTLRGAGWGAAIVVPVLASTLAGLAVVLLSVLASGAMGPDRLAQAGPAPWLTGGIAAAELGVGMLLGIAAGRADAARLGTLVELVRGGDQRAIDARDHADATDARSWSSETLIALDRVERDRSAPDEDGRHQIAAGGVTGPRTGVTGRLRGFLGFGTAAAGSRGDVDDADDTGRVDTWRDETGPIETGDGDDPGAEIVPAVEPTPEPNPKPNPDDARSLEPAQAPAEAALPERLDDVTEDELRVSESEAEAILAAYSWDGSTVEWTDAPEDRSPDVDTPTDVGTEAAASAFESVDPDAQETAPVDDLIDDPEDSSGPGSGRRVWRWPGRKR
ncbi:hypothetical protein GCM10009847_20980 [Leucobacter tardus]|uniref:Uncharacterized protein n=1 Tax=Leucobacter tardus TaxID=501483 RepID=A0A939TNC6_9MICO|nr:DUF6350 family protein [Leucobacter tardus]MBO2990388.1 hypothetical protein [Leucobacter tardus]